MGGGEYMIRLSVRVTVIALAFVFLIQGCSSTKLLTKNVEEIQKITVVNSRDGNRTSEIMQAKGNDSINTIYQSINITKTRIETEPSSSEEQTSEPYFTILIDYIDGTQDNIYSTEGGSFVYYLKVDGLAVITMFY